MEIAPGVHQITSGANAFVIDGDEGVTLVDAGLRRSAGRILARLASIGRSVEDVRAVVVTHGHVDHVGGLAALVGRSKAEVWASVGDAPIVRGEAPPPPPPMLDRMPFLKALAGRVLPAPVPAPVDHTLGDDPGLALPTDLAFIPTPGHTPGHVSYLLDRAGGVMFVGDAAVQRRGTVERGFFNKPDPVLEASIRRLADHTFEVACFGHSGPILAGAAGDFGAFQPD